LPVVLVNPFASVHGRSHCSGRRKAKKIASAIYVPKKLESSLSAPRKTMQLTPSFDMWPS